MNNLNHHLSNPQFLTTSLKTPNTLPTTGYPITTQTLQGTQQMNDPNMFNHQNYQMFEGTAANNDFNTQGSDQYNHPLQMSNYDPNLLLQKQVYLMNRTHHNYDQSSSHYQNTSKNNQTGDVCCTSSIQNSDFKNKQAQGFQMNGQNKGGQMRNHQHKSRKQPFQEYSKIDYTRSSQLNASVSYENDSSIMNSTYQKKKTDNIQRSENNQSTKPKDFCSKINPLKLKRQEQKQAGYVWFATYHNLIFEDELRKILSKPEFNNDSSFPQEMASIHLKDFDMHFGTHIQNSDDVQPFLLNISNSIAFLKVYLLTHTQFQKLIMHLTRCQAFSLPEKLKKGQCQKLQFDLNKTKEPFYNNLTKLGSLEYLDILCLNRNQNIHFKLPSKRLLSSLFNQYKHSFYNYSEHFILYYIFKRNQVRGNYSMRDLVEISVPELTETIKEQEKLAQNSHGLKSSQQKFRIQQHNHGDNENFTDDDDEERNRSNTTNDGDLTLRCTTCIIDSSSDINENSQQSIFENKNFLNSQALQHVLNRHSQGTNRKSHGCSKQKPNLSQRNQKNNINHQQSKDKQTNQQVHNRQQTEISTNQSRLNQEQRILNLFDIPDFNQNTGELNWKNKTDQIGNDFKRVMTEQAPNNFGGRQTTTSNIIENMQMSVHTSMSLASGRGFAFGGKILNGFGMGGEVNMQTELSDISQGQNGFFNQSQVLQWLNGANLQSQQQSSVLNTFR
eukprot:403360662